MLEDIRNVVLNCMPFDTGNMFMTGARFIETQHYYQIQYDLQTVPYIYFQEEGFTHYISGQEITKNKGFISNLTHGQLEMLVSTRFNGNSSPFVVDKTAVRQRALMIQQGVIDGVNA